MTRRRNTIPRRTAAGELEMNAEVAAAGMLWALLPITEGNTRAYWRAIKATHGDRIAAKVREAMPGCRPGFEYALGTFPPLPLIKPVPEEHLAQREHVDIEGVRHWYCGGPWQMSQAEYLREIGEVDGAEWRAYLAWRRSGFAPRYVCDDDPQQEPCKIIRHCCWQ